jgi:hypothetical protein
VAVELLERDQMKGGCGTVGERSDVGWLWNCWREIRCRVAVELLERDQM